MKIIVMCPQNNFHCSAELINFIDDDDVNDDEDAVTTDFPNEQKFFLFCTTLSAQQ
jgi:hypothetical protein